MYDSQVAAARALGIARSTYTTRLGQARRRCAELWFEHETPRRLTAGEDLKETCRYGHSRAQHSVVYANGNTVCRLCKRNAGRRQRARSGSGAE